MTAPRPASAASVLSRLVAASAAGVLALGVVGAVAPVADAAAVSVLSDSFSRSVVSGWGSAEVGGAWTTRGGSPSQYAVDGSAATMTLRAGDGPNVDANAVSALDQDITATVTADKIAAGGGNYVALVARRHSTNELYAVQLNLGAAKPVLALFRRNASEAQTNLGAPATSTSTFVAGAAWKIRFSVTGTDPTTLSAKAWPASDTEPSQWAVSTTDSTAALQSAGTPGIADYLSTKATNVPIVVSVSDVAVSATVVPAAPSGLAAVAGATSVDLSWDATSGADSYRVFRDGTLIASPSSTSYTDADLTPGTTYAYAVAATSTVGTSPRTAPVTATPPLPVPVAGSALSDSFSRSVVSGWGSAEVGGAWTTRGGSPSQYAVDGSAATMTLRAGDGPNVDANAVSALDQDITATVTADKIAAGGGNYVALVARRHSTNELYAVQLNLGAAKPVLALFRRNASEAQTNLGAPATSTSTFVAGAAWKIRFSVTGTDPTTLSAKAWPASDTEPSQWAVSTTDSTAALQSAGTPGIADYLSTKATNVPIVVSVSDVAVSATVVPAAPSGLAAVAGATSVDLSWDATSGADSYRVFRDGTLIASPSSTSYTDADLTPGTTYAYAVAATSTVGTSPRTAPVTATPPLPVPVAPTHLAAAAGDGRVDLTWSTVAAASSYSVLRDGTEIASVTEAQYADTGVINGTTYSYAVVAASSSGSSEPSGTAAATPLPPKPATPTSLTAAASQTRVALTWGAVPGADGYRVYRDGELVGSPTASSYADTGLTDGTPYEYTVSSVNVAGSSALSDCVSATPMPPIPVPPVGLTATGGDGRVSLAWPAVSGASGYRVVRDGTAVATVASTSYSDTAVSNGRSYGYSLVATNMAGGSAPSTVVNATPMPPVPAVPGGLSAAAGDTAVTVSWSAVSRADDYVVSRNGTVVATVSATSFTDTGLANGTTYSYTVAAHNITGTSGASTAVSARPLPPLPPAPSAPSLSAGDQRVTLSWGTVATATSYVVYRDGIAVAAGLTATSFTDTGLVDGTSYTYTVASTNIAGTSARSAAASATPMPPLPATPSGLAAVAGDAQVSLTWTAVPSATGYRVYRSGVLVASPTTPTHLDTALVDGTTYGYAVAAVNMSGSSALSSTVSATPARAARASAGAGAPALGSTSYPIPSGAVFVSTTGSDSSPGTLSAPVATVTKALALIPSGGTVVLRGGTYHQGNISVSKAATIQSYPGEVVWFDGTTKVSTWAAEGSVWRSDNWMAAFDHSPTYTPGAPDSTTPGWSFVNAAYPMAAYPDMVWIDGVELRPGVERGCRDRREVLRGHHQPPALRRHQPVGAHRRGLRPAEGARGQRLERDLPRVRRTPLCHQRPDDGDGHRQRRARGRGRPRRHRQRDAGTHRCQPALRDRQSRHRDAQRDSSGCPRLRRQPDRGRAARDQQQRRALQRFAGLGRPEDRALAQPGRARLGHDEQLRAGTLVRRVLLQHDDHGQRAHLQQRPRAQRGDQRQRCHRRQHRDRQLRQRHEDQQHRAPDDLEQHDRSQQQGTSGSSRTAAKPEQPLHRRPRPPPVAARRDHAVVSANHISVRNNTFTDATRERHARDRGLTKTADRRADGRHHRRQRLHAATLQHARLAVVWSAGSGNSGNPYVYTTL